MCINCVKVKFLTVVSEKANNYVEMARSTKKCVQHIKAMERTKLSPGFEPHHRAV